jgi:hypothetical protein
MGTLPLEIVRVLRPFEAVFIKPVDWNELAQALDATISQSGVSPETPSFSR